MKHDNDNINFFSVCSGIEAASVAWGPLGWKCAGVSEIEKFPSAVLKHHYPDVTNHGDFTKIDVATLGRVDIFCGGTPCQAFSVAGLRNSLADARGNLSLEFVRLAHELADGNGLRNVAWENVPGVLNTKDNAFGCFLGGLVGADDAVPPPHGSKWPDAGMVSGPRGRAAWRILDAQFFGLAQRRKRVIVVADFGNGADPAAVLFERVGVQGNSAPSREKREGVAPTISARTNGGGGLGTDFDLDGGLMAYSLQGAGKTSQGSQGSGYNEEVCFTLNRLDTHGVAVAQQVYSIMPQNSGKDYKARVVDVAQPVMAAGQTHGNQGGDVVCVTGTVTHTLKAEGADASEDGTGRGTPIVAFTQNQREEVREIEIAGSLSAEPGTHQQTFVAFDTTQITSKANRSNPKAGDPCHPLAAGAHAPAIAFSNRGIDSGDTTETLRAASHGALPMVAIDPVRYGPSNQDTLHHESGVLNTLPGGTHNNGGHFTKTVAQSAVRRLTPKECERLQGFPDGYTDIPWRGKPNSPDGPRYKALGNSWAVPKFAWLGERIQRFMPPYSANDNTPIKAAA